mgnify:CR=1 FL=1
MNPILIVAFLAVVGVAGDFFIKLAGHGPKFIEIKWFIIGLLIYASTAFGWFYVMKHIKLSSLGVIYSLTTVLFLVAIGVFYFHEKLNIYEIIGIITAIVSVILLSRFT